MLTEFELIEIERRADLLEDVADKLAEMADKAYDHGRYDVANIRGRQADAVCHLASDIGRLVSAVRSMEAIRQWTSASS